RSGAGECAAAGCGSYFPGIFERSSAHLCISHDPFQGWREEKNTGAAGGKNMRFVIQRVKEACVRVDNETVGAIRKGFLVLIGVSQDDTRETADRMIRKMLGLRIFEDENGKTNLSLEAVDGGLLLVS